MRDINLNYPENTHRETAQIRTNILRNILIIIEENVQQALKQKYTLSKLFLYTHQKTFREQMNISK